MRVRTVLILAGIGVAAVCAALGLPKLLHARAPSPTTWTLPHELTVKDIGPLAYKFTVLYNTANSRGKVLQRQRLTAEYIRGLPGGQVMWKNVTHATAEGASAPFGHAQKSGFMNGFRYPNDLALTFKPDFFKNFPRTAVIERNLVWDTGMIEMFGQNYFKHLKLNEPYHIASDKAVVMPDVGTFQNRDVVLEWVGRSERNGQDCALINYHAFFNPVAIANGGMTLNGRSDYWGEIWVSLATKQIEYATLQELVVGEMKAPGQNRPQAIDIFRMGTLAQLSTENGNAVRVDK